MPALIGDVVIKNGLRTMILVEITTLSGSVISRNWLKRGNLVRMNGRKAFAVKAYRSVGATPLGATSVQLFQTWTHVPGAETLYGATLSIG